jgi:hypothetical protein
MPAENYLSFGRRVAASYVSQFDDRDETGPIVPIIPVEGNVDSVFLKSEDAESQYMTGSAFCLRELDYSYKIVKHNRDLLSEKIDFPLSAILKNPIESEKHKTSLYDYGSLDISDEEDYPFSFMSEITGTLKFLSWEELKRSVSENEFGYLFYLVFRTQNPDLAMELVNNMIEGGLHKKYKSDFGCNLPKGLSASDSYYLSFIIKNFVKLFDFFSVENLDILQLNPFKSEIPDQELDITSVKRDSIEAQVARIIGNNQHFGQDAIVIANQGNNVLLLDGIGSGAGVMLKVRLFCEFYLQNPDCLSTGFDLTASEFSLKRDFGIPDTGWGSGFAAGIEMKKDEIAKTVSLTSIGDSYGIHFDKYGKIVQILGGECSPIVRLLMQQMNCISAEDIEEIKENGNILASSIGFSRKGFDNSTTLHCLDSAQILADVNTPAYSTASYEPGDFVVLMSDFIDKIYDFLTTSISSDSFSDRNSNVETNRSQRHPAYAAALSDFLASLKIEIENNVGVAPIKVIREILRKAIGTEFDDSSSVLIELDRQN